MGKAEFRQKLEELAEKFKANEDQYRSSSYNEENAKGQFIEPLFKDLGWTFEAEAGVGPDHCDVWKEKGETKGRPDYNFRIDGKTQFFVEAKAPHEKLGKNHILQAKGYGYQEPDVWFVALTNFEEFHLYKTAKKPDPKHPELDRVFSCVLNTTPTEETINNLWMLSKEEVSAGSLNKVLGKVSKKIPLDETLLADLTKWRESLAKNAKNRNHDLDEVSLNEVVQIFLDRLIFIRIAEDLDIRTAGELENILSQWKGAKHKTLYSMLDILFSKVNDELNGELFKDKPLLNKNTFDDERMAEVIEGLSPYNFATIGVDILGQIYERYLGKTIIVSAARARVDDKPEVRKAGGVYYTPKYIVDYIVKNTVGRLIEGKSPEELSGFRVLDPACGSGSFLLGAYQCLLDYCLNWYVTHKPEKFPNKIWKYGDVWRLTALEKKRILKENIYGVDIDGQAVEITMMSLYIKSLEGESHETLARQKQLSMSFEKTLPYLDTNIKCGNSLIGPDYFTEKLLPDHEEMRRINAFDWETQFPDAMKAGGFDCVIGNPPYGATFNKNEAEYFQTKYRVFSGAKDVYACFIEAGIRKLNRKGAISFIVPSAWLGGPKYESLRKMFLSYKIENIILLPFDIFKDAYVDTTIFAVSGIKPTSSHKVLTYVFNKKEKLTNIELSKKDYNSIYQKSWRKTENSKFILDSKDVYLFEIINNRFKMKFSDYLQIKRGVLFDKQHLTNRRTSVNSFRYFEGDVYRYQINVTAKKWIGFDDRMKERPKVLIWFEGPRILLRRLVNRRYRIMATYTEDAFITNKNLYSILPINNGIHIFVILALLNSKLISHMYINQVSQARKDDFPQVTIKDILALPFPEIKEKKSHDRLVMLVGQMLELHKRLNDIKSERDREIYERQIGAIDRKIDQVVYELYGLTEKEIGIVEGA